MHASTAQTQSGRAVGVARYRPDSLVDTTDAGTSRCRGQKLVAVSCSMNTPETQAAAAAQSLADGE